MTLSLCKFPKIHTFWDDLCNRSVQTLNKSFQRPLQRPKLVGQLQILISIPPLPPPPGENGGSATGNPLFFPACFHVASSFFLLCLSFYKISPPEKGGEEEEKKNCRSLIFVLVWKDSPNIVYVDIFSRNRTIQHGKKGKSNMFPERRNLVNPKWPFLFPLFVLGEKKKGGRKWRHGFALCEKEEGQSSFFSSFLLLSIPLSGAKSRDRERRRERERRESLYFFGLFSHSLSRLLLLLLYFALCWLCWVWRVWPAFIFFPLPPSTSGKMEWAAFPR